MTYKEWIQKQRCCVSYRCTGDICAHHLKTRGAGGKDEKNLLPLCVKHHTEIHQIGKITFSGKYNLDLETVCRLYWRHYSED